MLNGSLLMARITNSLQHPVVSLVLRVLVGCLFLYSGASKLGDLKSFAEAVENYRLLPIASINFFALVTPWLEVLAGLAVITGILLRGGAFLLVLLLLVFTSAIAISIATGVDISCGCSLPFSSAARVGWKKLGENLILLAAAWSVYKYGRPLFSL
jgi:uncharacterized membrane protein YphA (DoxX/SURF4 family)